MYYFYYVKDSKCLYKNLFQAIKRQLKYTSNIIEVVNKIKLREKQNKEGEDKEKKRGGVGTKKAINKLDNFTLKLSLTFI